MESPSSHHSWNTFQQADVYVTKIGGENAADFAANARTIAERLSQGKKQLVTVSALRSNDPRYGTYAHETAADHDKYGNGKPGFNATSHLIAMARYLQHEDHAGASDILERIRAFTRDIVQSDMEHHPVPHAEQAIEHAHAIIDRHVDALHDRIAHVSGTDVLELGKDWVLRSPRNVRSLTGFGEELAQALLVQGLAERGIAAAAIRTEGLATDVLGSDPETLIDHEASARQAVDRMRDALHRQIHTLLPSHDVLIAGGYLPIFGGQRGYSDKTGAFLAQIARQRTVRVAYLIEKRFPVMSADPVLRLPGTSVVEHMTFAMAKETFGNVHGADGGAIHPDALQMLADADVDTFVLNPAEACPGSLTHIRHFLPSPRGIELVAMRPMPLALRIHSTKMLNATGFLACITQWFSSHGISIDQVFTSEVTVSLTFTNGGVDDDALRRFRDFLHERYGPTLELEIIRNKTLIFGIGNDISGIRPLAALLRGLKRAGMQDVDFLMRGTREAVTVAVPAAMATAALAGIHETCIAASGNTGRQA